MAMKRICVVEADVKSRCVDLLNEIIKHQISLIANFIIKLFVIIFVCPDSAWTGLYLVIDLLFILQTLQWP